ncbi:hypothetical protein HK100_002061 [Physocladia obscura]|uniref:Indoleamine 2,3-dioxygenase n=1 Tax=Physocladia obscura TaxID=109957 RepID=A0AAD5SWB7_9FUNG|nr:hypothetical protein HK100_002061 [Physocladia obscura]
MTGRTRDREVEIPRLEDYGISRTTGFLPSGAEGPPLQRLPGAYFEAWEALLDSLQGQLLAGQLRRRVRQLPELAASEATLGSGARTWQRAYLVLSFLAQAYVWGKNEAPCEVLPRAVAVPLVAVCRRLRLPPIVSYAAVELYNYRALDTAPLTLANLSVMHTFSGGMDEAWFFIVSVAIEARGAAALVAVVDALAAVRDDSHAALEDALASLQASVAALTALLVRMYDKNDPYVFFNRVRPYMNGWQHAEDLPNGVLFEGVLADAGANTNIPNGRVTPEGTYGKYAGASAGQSALIHVLDVALGIVHLPTANQPTSPSSASTPSKPVNFILEMRNYMPGQHSDFIDAVANSYSIRDYIESLPPNKPSSIKATTFFNNCVQEMKKFRSEHIKMVSVYIVSQANKRKDVGNAGVSAEVQSERLQNGLLARGTGGTNLIPFLKQARNETGDATISTTTTTTSANKTVTNRTNSSSSSSSTDV